MGQMSQEEEFAKGFLRGFREGLQDAWDEIIKLSMKGYTSRELQIMAKTKRSMISRKVSDKTEEFERVLGKKLSVGDAATEKPAATPEIIPGWSYLLREERPGRSFALFSTILSQGGKGLCISRTHPDTLKQKYGFEAESLWLTKTEAAQGAKKAKHMEFVSPNNLARLASAVREFLSQNKNGAVIIEGLEYLNTQNDFKSVLKFVQLINEQVVLDKGYLMIPVDGATMDPKERSLIEREMSQVI
ncbi:MAG: DUF835 domain-containing protein [Methanobacteriota archaeon]|nr:MAG: DUF835 domain-containing protein [Euryarchaeota archaeon]